MAEMRSACGSRICVGTMLAQTFPSVRTWEHIDSEWLKSWGDMICRELRAHVGSA